MSQTGTVAHALHVADQMLGRNPALAAAQARAVLAVVPDHPHALLIHGRALARLGELPAARAVLEPLARAQPRAALVHLEYGQLLAALGDIQPAITALHHALALQPALPQGWRVLADLLFLTDQKEAADAAYARHLLHATADPALMAAGHALAAGDLAGAEQRLRAHLAQMPSDVAALRMLAEVATRLGRYPAAEALLERSLERAPGFSAARYHYAVVLYRQNRAIEALPQMERLIAAEPHSPRYRLMLASCLATTGAYDRAIEIYAALVDQSPDLPKLWLGYGHALRTAGRRDQAIAAYRAILPLAPALGEAWWSIANLKTASLGPDDERTMRAALARSDITVEDQIHLHYALGRTREEAGDYAASFTHYATGARLRRAELPYQAAATTAQIEQTIALCTPDFFARRAGSGNADPAPIFIIGLPRSGSTLLEQILASHPLVEGTMELPELANVARPLCPAAAYPQGLAAIPPDLLAQAGASYLRRAQAYRRTDRPYFIDKMPNNWVHVGLIHLILPAARIIDARRHPMAACFSTFKQHFARGQHYSYDLAELGRYYRDYLRLMAHFDAVLPGRVHRVRYEAVVEQTEAEIRALLNHCGLAYDPACLRFFENQRPVRTASSEQVRRPIFRDGLDHWRHYEPWLSDLAAALS